mmetsp:Transcript_32357/g.54148  ORF Transcript_32357/g.54148 Transcript_32357/m.54148 type:complete len:146 (+) Transcript_32357:146-583(+)
MSVSPACQIQLNRFISCVADMRNGNCINRCFDPPTRVSGLPISMDFLGIPDFAETCGEFEEPLCSPFSLPGCCPSCSSEMRFLYRCNVLQAMTPDGMSMYDETILGLARSCRLNCADFEQEIEGIDISSNVTDIDDNSTRFLRLN